MREFPNRRFEEQQDACYQAELRAQRDLAGEDMATIKKREIANVIQKYGTRDVLSELMFWWFAKVGTSEHGNDVYQLLCSTLNSYKEIVDFQED